MYQYAALGRPWKAVCTAPGSYRAPSGSLGAKYSPAENNDALKRNERKFKMSVYSAILRHDVFPKPVDDQKLVLSRALTQKMMTDNGIAKTSA